MQGNEGNTHVGVCSMFEDSEVSDSQSSRILIKTDNALMPNPKLSPSNSQFFQQAQTARKPQAPKLLRFRTAILDVAKAAVRNGGRVPQRAHDLPELAPATQWMSEQSILRRGVVGSEYVSVEVVLSEAVPCADGCKSRIAIIQVLKAAGWQAAASSSSSLVGKRFNPNSYLEYFCILRDHLLLAQQYDEQYAFRYSQTKGYYDALLCAFERSPDDIKLANLEFSHVGEACIGPRGL